MARNHYYLSIADLAHARGDDPRFAYDGAGPNDFAAALQQALRDDGLFSRAVVDDGARFAWRDVPADPALRYALRIALGERSAQLPRP